MKLQITISLVVLCISAHAQTFDQWVEKQISDTLDKQQVGENGKGGDRQRESPSTDPRSTSLVDKTSATDFISIAANLIPVTPGGSMVAASGSGGSGSSNTGSASGSAGSGTATTTLYAILAGLNAKSPTDPAFYKDHVTARRFSFTAGTAASTLANDNSDKPSTVLGTKILLQNNRELYTKGNLVRIRMVQDQLSRATASGAGLKSRIRDIIFVDIDPQALDPNGDIDRIEYANFLLAGALSDAIFPMTLNRLSADAKKRIEDVIISSIDSFASLRKTIQDAYDDIKRGSQISIAYTANIRKDKGNNDHRAELIVDYGVSNRINWTFNASADYTDRKTARDSKGARAATQFEGALTKANSAWGRLPMKLSFSGEAIWLTNQKPQYTGQAQLTIPVSQGVDLPIVYRYANRIAQLNQKDSEVRLGFSVDLSRLAQAFK